METEFRNILKEWYSVVNWKISPRIQRHLNIGKFLFKVITQID